MKTPKKRRDTVQISISLPLDVAAALDETCLKERRQRSTLLTVIIEKYLGIYDRKTAAMIREAKNNYGTTEKLNQ